MRRKMNACTGLLSCPCCGDEDIMTTVRAFDGAGVVYCDMCGKGVLRCAVDGGIRQARKDWQELDSYWEGCCQD